MIFTGGYKIGASDFDEVSTPMGSLQVIEDGRTVVSFDVNDRRTGPTGYNEVPYFDFLPHATFIRPYDSFDNCTF